MTPLAARTRKGATDGSLGRRRPDQPTWTQRGHRSIPKVEVPRLAEVAPDICSNQKPLGMIIISRPLVAFVGFVAMAINGWWAATPLVVWFFYGSNLSAMHHLMHGSLGMTAKWRHRWLSVLGCLVGESGHALQATHTVHHRDGTDLPDPEGYIEYLTWAQMPLGALQYRYRMMWWGWTFGARRARISAEIAVHVASVTFAVAAVPFTRIPLAYLALVQASAFAFAILQGKGPQANWGREMPTPLLLLSTRLLAVLFFSHHQHLEHHAYPKVPLPRLGELRPVVEAAVADAEVIELDLWV